MRALEALFRHKSALALEPQFSELLVIHNQQTRTARGGTAASALTMDPETIIIGTVTLALWEYAAGRVYNLTSSEFEDIAAEEDLEIVTSPRAPN